MASLEPGSHQIDIERGKTNGASSKSTSREGSPKAGVGSSQAGSSKYTRTNSRGVTRMGSLMRSPSQPITPDDVEAQRHRSQWLTKVRTTLHLKHEEREKNKWGFCILKVPEIHRQPPEEFTPGAWRFGLHNRENLDTNGSEALKISYANAVGLVGDDLEKFCNAVVDDPKSLLRCYGLQEEASSWSDEVIKYVLSLDALYLALEYDWRMPDEYLWTSEQMASIEEDVLFQSRNTSWVESNVMDHDTCKFENQIPFQLIRRACTYLRKLKVGSTKSDEAEVWEKQWKATAVGDGIDSFINVPESVKVGQVGSSSQHILGFAYEVVCGGLERTSDGSQSYYIHVPPARRLRDSGIKIVGVGGALCDMSYNKDTRCLTLPRMKIFDQTVAFVRNMARYEEYSDDDRCTFHDYVLFMLDLIESPEDLRFLIDCDVIHNECGVRGFEMWTGLEQGITAVPASKEHNEMKAAINRRCKLRQHRFWSEIRTLFLSRPWYTLFALAVALITIGTLIQTYAAVIDTNRMKPKYRP